MARVLLLAMASMFLFLSPTQGAPLVRFMDKWCDRTPNPNPCKYFLMQDPKNLIPMGKMKFRETMIQLAMRRAERAHKRTQLLEPKCRNQKEKMAWSDCVDLYQDTISLLNSTLSPRFKSADFDTQTWLSTALTNLETCRTGFRELRVADYVFPLMTNNVTKLIVNSLSLSKKNASSVPPMTYVNGFPNWVSPGDRKLLQASFPAANLVVAKDGTGNFRTIGEAVKAASKRAGIRRFVIYIKQGVYSENIEVGKKQKNIMFVGDGIGKTIITGSRSVGGGYTTFRSATLAVTGGGFIARDLTVRNTAGPQKHQAVALRSGSDLSAFYRCSFEGYQDTLYVHSQRQFYRECSIYGTVDFIFGNAAAVLQNCMILPRKPMAKQKNTITAQGRVDSNQNTGISIINSRVIAAPDLVPALGSVQTFLGRPWKQYSRTVFIQTYLDSLIAPAGWLEWSGNFALSTLYYGEYRNTGPGSSTSGRVRWKGYRVITSPAEASKFTAQNFIAGGSWLQSTNIPFTLGL